ncbi:MAG TPA: hypothetical protein VGI90_16455 [Steroidobacteraceae bacterium]|jgi:hypothetical protein
MTHSLSAIFRRHTLALGVLLLVASSALADVSQISAADAIKYVGKIATVCGQVATAKYASNANGQPAFLNLDEPYPNQVFTALVWGKDRAAFPYAPESLAHRHICVTGKVQLYREKAEIVVSSPDQVKTTD